MNNRCSGLVLKVIPGAARKISILTRENGKLISSVSGASRHLRLCPGLVINCLIKPYKSGFFITDPVLESMPLMTTLDDINFWHHLLELAHNFFVVGEHNPEAFDFMHGALGVCQRRELFEQEVGVLRSALVGALLIVAGYYPPQELETSLVGVKDIMIANVDIAWGGNIHFVKAYLHDLALHAKSSLNLWTQACIQSHPRAKYFKTIRNDSSV